MRRSALSRCSAGLVVRRGVGASVTFRKGTGVREDDNRGAVVRCGGVGEVCLAENWRRGEVHARTKSGRAEGERKRAVRGRRWVKVCAVLETWAKGSPRHHSKRARIGERMVGWRWWLGETLRG